MAAVAGLLTLTWEMAVRTFQNTMTQHALTGRHTCGGGPTAN